MGPIEALELALRKEVEAKELYQRLSAEHSQLKDMFLFLVNEEEKHKKLLEEKISKIKG